MYPDVQEKLQGELKHTNDVGTWHQQRGISKYTCLITSYKKFLGNFYFKVFILKGCRGIKEIHIILRYKYFEGYYISHNEIFRKHNMCSFV